ncbi:conserved hypothetical protein, partial [delta proteobacterium NaphS2]
MLRNFAFERIQFERASENGISRNHLHRFIKLNRQEHFDSNRKGRLDEMGFCMYLCGFLSVH